MSQKEITLKFIEDLRKRKENIKRSIMFLNNEIINCDMQIRDLRIYLGRLENEDKKTNTAKPIETLAQKHNRLLREIAELEIQLGVNQQ